MSLILLLRREDLDTLWENNKILIIANAILAAVFFTVGILYGIEGEFVFYEIMFILIVTIMACILNYIKIREMSRKVEVPKGDDAEERWEQIREKEDFFALWAHQIKTPIAALRLLMQNDSPDLGDCRRKLFRIESYVEMALNFIRFEGISGDLVLEECSLDKMVKQVVKKNSTIFIHQHLSVELEDLDENILTDEKWFSFVLDQILSNALKYTKKGGVKIFTRESEDCKEVIVRDTGMGIRSEDIPRVFEKGYTGYNGRIDKKASGLGLYLCKGVCDK